MKIAELPFRERPIDDLLHFDDERSAVDRTYAGYGWARVPAIWLVDDAGEERVDDALVVAVHSADDGEPLPDDIELEFELPGREPVTVLASQFLATWLPMLPHASAIVLALCNPHHAVPRFAAGATVPVHVAAGDVESWIDDNKGGRLELTADGSWARVTP